jgi:transcriptional regulator with XRE-family HTH domain
MTAGSAKEGDREFVVEMGWRVRRERRSKGFSQEQLAVGAGLHRTTIGLIENGERGMRLQTALAVIRVLRVDPTEMFDGIDWIAGSEGVRGAWNFARPAGRARSGLVLAEVDEG